MTPGSKVKFKDTESERILHRKYPEYFPAPGTVGVLEGGNSLVQWPRGSTSRDDRWLTGTWHLTSAESEAQA